VADVPFSTTLKVRFGDVDRAGIAYYPVIFHYCHVAFEEYFEHHVGIPYPRVLEERRLGFPTVKVETSFERPFRYGATVRVEVAVESVGRSSVTWRYAFHDTADGALLARSVHTTVAVNMDDFTPRPVPDDLRARLR
jgi:YbgC/YbaW family acyl-CoA thioester hydrolase